MAKKKVKINNLRLILSAVAALFAVVAFFLMFAPAATFEVVGTKGSYSGAQMTFGYTETTTVPIVGTEIKSTVLNFSFLNLLPYILLVAGIVFNFLNKFCKFSNFISAGCYVVAGVLFFLVIVMCAPNVENADLVNSFKENLTLGAGAIVAGILSILAALASLSTLFIKK